MTTEISGRNYELTPQIRAFLEKKLAKVEEKLFNDVIDVRCVLQVEKYRNICEIIIVGKDHDVKTKQESDESMQDAINAAIDHVKRQAQKNRKKIRDHHRGSNGKGTQPVTEWAVQVLEPGKLRETGDHNRPRIIRTNNLPILPMTIEDAAMRLDDSRSEFIVFREVDTEKVHVMYKRKDKNLGLIAPEV